MRICLFLFLMALSAQIHAQTYKSMHISSGFTFETGLKLFNEGVDTSLEDVNGIYLGVSIWKVTPTNIDGSMLVAETVNGDKVPFESSEGKVDEFLFDDPARVKDHLVKMAPIRPCYRVISQRPLVTRINAEWCNKIAYGQPPLTITYRTNGHYLIGLLKADEEGNLVLRKYSPVVPVHDRDIVGVYIYVMPLTN